MKNILCALTLIVALVSCSSDREQFPGVGEHELAFVSFEFKIQPLEELSNNKVTDRYVYLFRLDGKHLATEISPYALDYAGERICTIDDVNGDVIESDYSGTFTQKKNDDGYYILSGSAAIYTRAVNGRLMIGDYLLVVETCGSYFCKKLAIKAGSEGKYEYYKFDLVQTKDSDGNRNYIIWF